MSTDEREAAHQEHIDRLTQLARRVWPDAKLVVHNGNWRVKHSLKVVDGQAAWVEPLFVGHPRALDALEAALQVLAGEDRHESMMRYAKAMQERAEAAEAELKKLSAELDWRRTLQTIHEDP